MKTLKNAPLWLLILLLIPSMAFAQSRSAKKAHKREVKQGWDITLPPIERAPENTIKARDITPTAADNWGRRLILPDDIRNRLKAECTRPVKVKILDTGGAFSHDLLKQGQSRGRNYTTSATLDDMQGHATHVAGIIAGNGFGIANELVKSGKLTFEGIKVLNDNGSGSFTWFANAVSAEYAQDEADINAGIAVIYNASLGGGTAKVTSVEDAFKRSTAKGVLFFVAAGNTGGTGVQYPGNSTYVTAVGSIGEQIKVSYFSTRGPEVMLGMPGERITSTYLNNTLADLSGTSMATPMATGLAAIAVSKWGLENLNTPEKMRAYIAWVCTDISPVGKDNDTGYGIAYVRNVLDKNPKDIGTVPPVDPPKDTTIVPPVREKRMFTVEVKEPGKIVWGATIALPASGKPQPYVFTATKSGLKKAGATNVLTVTGVDFFLNESGKAETIIEGVERNAKQFFKGRGLVLAQNADFQDAAYWTAYFLDMAFDREFKTNVVILGIRAKNEAGLNVYIQGKDLKQWK